MQSSTRDMCRARSLRDIFMKQYLPHRYAMITIGKPGYMLRVQKEMWNVYGKRISQEEAQTWIDDYRISRRRKFTVPLSPKQ